MSNSRSEPVKQSSPAAEFATGRLWDALLDDDQPDLDLDLLAAYAEGALEAPERQRAKSLIERSPRAMELLHGLHADLRPATPAALPATSPARQVARPNRALSVMSWLVAVALLIAFGTTYRQLQVQRQVVVDRDFEKGAYEQQIAALTTQLASEGAAVAAVRRERLYVLSSARRPYMTSRGEPGIARLALAHRETASRGFGESSPETQAARDAEITAVLQQGGVKQPDNVPAQLDRAAQFLAAGDFANARALIAQMESDSGESAATLNLSAAINLAEAYERATPSEARVLQSAARDQLQRAMQLDPLDPRPWFNLALLEEDVGNDSDADIAWSRYLELETDEALKNVVRTSRGL
ncbi:MAG: hypothetical protein JNG89_00145 [Planctomycetaceae bacterium]|nr:hypothetical protein [Planctomycetaceae bacterium]